MGRNNEDFLADLKLPPYIDFRHSETPLRQSRNDEWHNDYRAPGER